MTPALKLAFSLWFLVFSLFFLSTPAFAQTPIDDGTLPNSVGNPGANPAANNSGGASAGKSAYEAGSQPLTPANYNAPVHADYTINVNILGQVIPCAIIDTPLIPNNKGCVKTNSNGQLSLNKTPGGGVLGMTVKGITALYNPPLSSKEYLADLGESFGLVKPVYAQNVTGAGNGVIDPIKNMWKLSRNISYVVFILVFLAVGIMIMFRQKLNPQTVINVQNSLPGLVLGLILITFSYFFSALIIDLSFLGMKVVTGFFFASGVFPDNLSVLGVNFRPLLQGGAKTLGEDGNIFTLFIYFINYAPLTFLGANDVIGEVFKLFNSVLGAAIPIIGIGGGLSIGFIVAAIILLGLAVQMIRLFIKLVTAYISILVTSIFAPFIILAASLPGRGKTLETWWKTLLANVLIFPAVYGAFLLALAILGSGIGDFNQALPLFGGIPISLLKLIIAFGIVMGTPGVADAILKAFKVQGPTDIISAALGGFGAGVAAGRAGWGAGTGGIRRQSDEYWNRQAQLKAGTAPQGAGEGRWHWAYQLLNPFGRRAPKP